MPNTLPVPSEAALRALRNLALGTSCTVAFTAGLLTEDRRRRIHVAREVHANAKKLRSSRKYHSAASPSAESSEEQGLRYRDDGFWQADLHPRTVEPAQTVLPLEPTISDVTNHRKKPHFSVGILKHDVLNNSASRWKPLPAIRRGPDLSRTSTTPPKINERSVHDRQQKLASDVVRLLHSKNESAQQDEEQSSHVEAAAGRFFDAFEEGLPSMALVSGESSLMLRFSSLLLVNLSRDLKPAIRSSILFSDMAQSKKQPFSPSARKES